MASSNLHFRAESVTPPQNATVMMHRSELETAYHAANVETPRPITYSGDYELLKVLGRGGMGIVYLARQRGLKRKVAYKVLTQLGNLDPETLDRFQSEAETLAKLQHTGIVQVYDSGTTKDSPYLAMEYVSGGSLAERQRTGRLEPRAVATILSQVAGAVGHAHTHGIIHRDLKPANILLTESGQPKVVDFGLARDVAGEHVTRTGFIAGTPCYMAPEQLVGRRDLGPTVDVWALGVMLYELIAGNVPFAGDDPQQILTNIMRHDPIPLRHWQPNLPRDLETICMKCLQKEPHRRYPSGTQLAEDLHRFLDGHTILARPVGRIEKSIRWTRRNPLVAGLLAVTATALVAATAISLAFAQRAHASRQHAEQNAAMAYHAMIAEQALLEDARRLVSAEKQAREEAERAAAAEKKAREDSERMSGRLEDLITGIKPGTQPLKGLLRHIDNTEQSLDADVHSDPLVRARIYFTLGMTRRGLGEYAAAIPPMERAHALRVRHLGLGESLVRSTAHELSYTYYHVQRTDDAILTLRPAIEASVAAGGEESDETIGHLSLLNMIYASAGRTEDADLLGDRLVELHTRKHGTDHAQTEWARINLRKYQVDARRFHESIPVLRKAYARLMAEYGPDFYQTNWCRVTLGLSLLRDGQPRVALPYLESNYRSAIHEKGYVHVHSIYATRFLAECYEALDRMEEAVPLRRSMFEYHRDNGNRDLAAAEERLMNRDLAAVGKN